MKCLSFCVLALLASFALAQLASDVPLFAWSGMSCVGGQNLPISSALTNTHIEALLESLVRNSPVPPMFSSVFRTCQPEVLVVFVEPHLSLSEFSSFTNQLPVLRNIMQTAAGSMYAPYVDLSDSSLVSAVTSCASSTDAKTGSVIFAGKGTTLLPELKTRVPKVKAVSLNMLEKTLESSKIFNNQITDVVVVVLDGSKDLDDKFSHANDMISSIDSLIMKKTKNYVAVYTGLSFSSQWADQYESNSKRFYLEVEDFLYDDFGANVTNGTIPNWFQQFFPGWFWEVTLVLIFVFPIIITGYCQLMSVQAPDYFVPPSRDKLKRS